MSAPTHKLLTCPKCGNVQNHHRDYFDNPTYCDHCRTTVQFEDKSGKYWDESPNTKADGVKFGHGQPR